MGLKWNDQKNRLGVFIRAGSCAALLLLLAVCGYMGASGGDGVQAVSVPVSRVALEEKTLSSEEMGDIRTRLSAQRQAEIAMLDGVLGDESASETTKNSALLQKTQIAQRMDVEAQVIAALGFMGHEDAAAVCGAGTLTIFLPYEDAAKEEEMARILDAAAGQSGLGAENIKIILAKK